MNQREYEVVVSQTLSRTVKIKMDAHSEYMDADTDWRKVYENADFKIQDLLLELKGYVQSDLAMTGPTTGKGIYLQRLLKACDGWSEDGYEVIENW